jgi:hypothetical protein
MKEMVCLPLTSKELILTNLPFSRSPASPDDRVVALLMGEPECRLDGASDPEIAGEVQDERSCLPRRGGGAVRGSVADDQDVVGVFLPEGGDDPADRLLFTVGGDGDEDARISVTHSLRVAQLFHTVNKSTAAGGC